MVPVIKELTILNPQYHVIEEGRDVDYLSNLSRVNIFVGPNNCGKSRLLRDIISKEIFPVIEGFDFANLNTAITSIKSNISEYIDRRRINPDPLTRLINELKPYSRTDPDLLSHSKLRELIDAASNFEKRTGTRYPSGPTNSEIQNFCMDTINHELEKINLDIQDIIEEKKPFKKIYIPTLRGLRTFSFENDHRDNSSNNDDDIYRKRTALDYFNEFGKDIEIFSGLEAYRKVRDYLLGDLKSRKLISDYQKFLSRAFFEGKEVVLIPKTDHNDLSIKIGDEQERPIYELGDGIQSLIILTMPHFLFKNEDILIVIEEPELFLHPGLQRRFLEIIASEPSECTRQYFVTTHSNHLLDLTLDYENISVFHVKKIIEGDDKDEEKIPSFTIENLAYGDQYGLRLLGVRNSSVFLSNCTIWVEGITDRKYLRKYLEIFNKHYQDTAPSEFFEYKEDLHYSFVEYGGANITHWSFLDYEEKPINVKRLCGRLFLITDKDEKKNARHAAIKDNLGDRYYLLQCREIENLVSPIVLRRVLEEYEGHEIERPFRYSDYKNNYLGKFIENSLDKFVKRNRKYSNINRKTGKGTGTIGNKVDFCNKVISHTNEWNDLSDETKEMMQKIYDFIKYNN